ncbi:MAG: hypothetical protein QOI63_1198 [Thermoplasmata archaeon]|jgi:hypothetical protein|nr:hypothetical protein [Thermoplasmata archaeon]
MAKSPARLWLLVLGYVLLAVAVLGLVQAAVDLMHKVPMHIEAGEDAVHWVLGLLTLGLAYGVKDEAMLAQLSIWYGVVYLLVGILGFFVNVIGPWHVAVADDILHLLLGVATLGAGLASRRAPMARTTPA